MPAILSSALTILLMSLSSQAQAQELTCLSGKLSQMEFGTTKTEVSEYCFNSERTVLLSKNCQAKTCEAFKSSRNFTIDELLSTLGTPGFKLCYELGGRPQIVDFYVENRPFRLDRCLFVGDGGYVDTDYLLSFYLKRASKTGPPAKSE